ncbi:MAG: virulence factor BrkB family protein [Chromatiales bacterium]|jgi:membrane protein|nr:virulence factor BrkB family protein [Chromatiales bacterium]
MSTLISRARRFTEAVRRFCILLYRRFDDDRCLMTATALSYTTLLSLVPLLVVVFSIISSFPVFEKVTGTIQEYVFRNFLPAAGETIQAYLTNFMARTGTLTGVGIATLVVTALMLMNTIDGVLNRIWRVHRSRSIVAKMATYWATLTLGPMLLAISIVATSYLVTLSKLGAMASSALLGWLPFLFTSLALTLLYVLVPNRRVPLRYGLISAVLAAALFEIAKAAFAYYVAAGPVYTTIYGALATIPLFLVWIYVSWAIVLLGAEFNYCLTVFRLDRFRPVRDKTVSGLISAYRVLGHLWQAQLQGKTLTAFELVKHEPRQDLDTLNEILQRLESNHLVYSVDSGAWGVSRDLGEFTLMELYRLFPGPLTVADLDGSWSAVDPWNLALYERLCEARKNVDDAMGVPLKQLYRGSSDGA